MTTKNRNKALYGPIYIISGLMLILSKAAHAVVPVLIPVGKGLAWLAAALGLGSKAVLLTAAALKAAAIGTAFIVKGVAFTKTGALVLTVSAGGVAYNQVTDSTVQTLNHLEYQVDSEATLPLVKSEISEAVKAQGSYSSKYCLNGDGKKVLIPNSYKVCPMDGSDPLIGHKFEYTNQKNK